VPMSLFRTLLLTDTRLDEPTPNATIGMPGRRGSAATVCGWLDERRIRTFGETMRTWTVAGEQATDRDGAAEYLGRSRKTIKVYATPYGRRTYQFPDPLPERIDGVEVFALSALDAFTARRQRLPRAAARPIRDGVSVAGTPTDDDPERFITVAEFAALRGISRKSMDKYVKNSIPAWVQGKDGYLPRPVWPPAAGARGRGRGYQWPLGTALKWVAAPRRGGLTAGPRPTVDDLRAVLATAEGPDMMSLVDIAGALSRELETNVSVPVARRLRQRLEKEQDFDQRYAE
jgi:hypothetical protein